MDRIRRIVLAALASLLLLPSGQGLAQTARSNAAPSEAASQIAEIFSQVGDQIYEDCIFELSPEQIEVQHALMNAYIENGASSALARELAVKQIRPPKLSAACEKLRHQARTSAPSAWETTLAPETSPAETAPEEGTPDEIGAVIAALPAPKPEPARRAPKGPAINFREVVKGRKVLPQWDCAPNVDYVTIHLAGFARKLTGGEICNPYEDVVHAVPVSAGKFRFGYTIATGRLFVVSDNPRVSGKTIAWAISGRDVCRNNPDPDCIAAKGVGSLPPGEYTFSADKNHRITWGPKTKRNVIAIYLRKLWNQNRFTRQQVAAILKRGNIAIHRRLKGEMSEACIGLEERGWAYVASLVKEGRATGLDVYLDEPYPQIAEAPPVVVASSFSLTSLFK